MKKIKDEMKMANEVDEDERFGSFLSSHFMYKNPDYNKTRST